MNEGEGMVIVNEEVEGGVLHGMHLVPFGGYVVLKFVGFGLLLGLYYWAWPGKNFKKLKVSPYC